jgi:transcriptional regulator with XRE-family HTH domain
MEKIAHALREARVSAGINQKELAAVLGIGPSYMNDIELARRTFPERFLPLLPAAIRKSVADAMIAEYQATIDRVREYAG